MNTVSGFSSASNICLLIRGEVLLGGQQVISWCASYGQFLVSWAACTMRIDVNDRDSLRLSGE